MNIQGHNVMKKIMCVFILGIFLFQPTFILAGGKSHARFKYLNYGHSVFGKKIAGTYYLKLKAQGSEEVFLRIATLTADGNWFSIDAHQQSEKFGFSDQQGVWKKTGYREVTAKVLDFDHDPQTEEPTGVARLRFVMTFNANLNEVSGEFSGTLFTLEQNPLDPAEIPIGSFDASFTGQRMMVN